VKTAHSQISARTRARARNRSLAKLGGHLWRGRPGTDQNDHPLDILASHTRPANPPARRSRNQTCL